MHVLALADVMLMTFAHLIICAHGQKAHIVSCRCVQQKAHNYSACMVCVKCFEAKSSQFVMPYTTPSDA